MSRVRVTITVCDWPGCTQTQGVHGYAVRSGTRVRKPDLCPEHGEPLEALLRLSVAALARNGAKLRDQGALTTVPGAVVRRARADAPEAPAQSQGIAEVTELSDRVRTQRAPRSAS